METTTDSPPVSIIIASYNSASTIEDCLRALAPQCGPEAAEVVVVDSGGDDSGARIEAGFPWVRLIRSEERLYPGGARNLGIEGTRGRVIAFIDADCIADLEWVRRIREAHQRPAAVIGGVIEIARPRGPLDWAAYFCSFHLWMPGAPEGPTDDIPTCCLSVKRDAFERYGPFRPHGFSSDTEFNRTVIEGGDRVELDPKIRVGHIAHPRVGQFVSRFFVRGRAFAMSCVRSERLSGFGRAMRIVRAPLVPLVLYARIVRRAWATECPYRGRLLLASPWVIAGYALWAAGEAAGYASVGSS